VTICLEAANTAARYTTVNTSVARNLYINTKEKKKNKADILQNGIKRAQK
jgi:hypothetical protein